MADVLNKYKYKKVKTLTNYKGAEVIQVGDAELAKLKKDNTLQVFEDKVIHISKPKEGRKNTLQQITWGVQRVGADKAWSTTTGSNIRVAVVDSGIARHKDIQQNIAGEFNATDVDKPAIDDFGHGTHVAGIIAARNNKVGIVGIAPDVKLYSVKILNSDGTGYLSDLVGSVGYDETFGNGILKAVH